MGYAGFARSILAFLIQERNRNTVMKQPIWLLFPPVKAGIGNLPPHAVAIVFRHNRIAWQCALRRAPRLFQPVIMRGAEYADGGSQAAYLYRWRVTWAP